jgi:predicted phosphodiesterase
MTEACSQVRVVEDAKQLPNNISLLAHCLYAFMMFRSHSYSRRFLLLRQPGLARRSAAATAAAFLLFSSHELIASFIPTTRGRHSTRCHALNDKGCTNEERVQVGDSIVEKLQLYHATHHDIPLPAVSHVRLTEQDLNPNGRNILVIGDVHACIEELQALHDSAMQSNGGRPFRCVILAGDLVNKGPQSAAVLTEVRQQPYWYAIRGNNDDSAIAAILSHNKAKLKKYKWDEAQQVRLTSQDIVWWSELPYTITIPRYIFEMDADKTNSDQLVDAVIVHGGLCPDVLLEEQTIRTMVTTRNLIQIDMSSSFFAKTEEKGADRYKKWKGLYTS